MSKSSYLTRAGAGTLATPQSQPIPGSGQVPNSAGGHGWKISAMDRMRRFLVLGSEGGSYYAGEQKLTLENLGAVREALDAHGVKAVAEIVRISHEGRAPKNDPALFALAMAAGHPDEATRKAALVALPQVARIGTHLFSFMEFVKQFRGRGRALRRALAGWYTEKTPEALAYQAVKYRARGGWSHADVLSLARPVPPSPAHDAIFRWLSPPDSVVNAESFEQWTHRTLYGAGGHGDPFAVEEAQSLAGVPAVIEGFERVQRADSLKETARLVAQYRLPREALPTEALNSKGVWEALLFEGGTHGMPVGAMLRNLGKMTAVGLLEPMGKATEFVCEALTDEARLKAGRIHPFALLVAMVIYERGFGEKGSLKWEPVAEVVNALDEAFYLAFAAVEPTGKRVLLGLDVSGSMQHPIEGAGVITARRGAAAMALVTQATEAKHELVAFSSGAGAWFPDKAKWGYRDRFGSRLRDGIERIAFSPRQRLDDVMRQTDEIPMGGTDCALPILYAIENEREVDAFVVYTDGETWAGGIHPSQALAKYRKVSGIDAKLVAVAMTANGVSIADPNDAGMLDVVGFDTSAPAVISDFIAGRI